MYQISNSLNGGKSSALQKLIRMVVFVFFWVNTNLKLSVFVIGLLKQKSSLFSIRSLQNLVYCLKKIVHCLSLFYQPLAKPVCIGWWRPFFLRCAQTSQSRLTKRALICYLLSYYQDSSYI